MVNSESMSSDQVEWNMAALLNLELAKQRSSANSYFISGKYREAVDSLIAMKMTGVHAFTKKERDELAKIEEELLNALINIYGSGSFNKIISAKAVESAMKIRKVFPRYNEKLMDFLHTHGFLGSYKRDAGSMRI